MESQMNGSLNRDIEAWEGEGGAVLGPVGVPATLTIGMASQVEWAERIKRRVNDEEMAGVHSDHRLHGGGRR